MKPQQTQPPPLLSGVSATLAQVAEAVPYEVSISIGVTSVKKPHGVASPVVEVVAFCRPAGKGRRLNFTLEELMMRSDDPALGDFLALLLLELDKDMKALGLDEKHTPPSIIVPGGGRN